MADLISRKALVTKLSQGYWDWRLQQAKNDPCVIDAMIDWAIRIVNEMPLESPWHTGTPTEGGLYFVYDKYAGYGKRELPIDASQEDIDLAFCHVLAWISIEPYKENEMNPCDGCQYYRSEVDLCVAPTRYKETECRR